MPWQDVLPENVREWDEVKTAGDDPQKFWDQISNHREFLGQSIRIPGPDAGDEAWAKFNEKLVAKVPTLIPAPNTDDPVVMDAFYSKIGRPAKPEDYKIPEMKVEVEGYQMDMKPIEILRPIAHKHGVTQKQFEGIVKEMTEANAAMVVESGKAKAEKIKGLETEWGAAYEQNYSKAIAAAKNSKAPEALLKALESKQADPSVVKWLHSLSETMGGGEDNPLLRDKNSNNKPPTMTPAEAQERIDEIMGNREHPYWIASHPQHKDAMERMLRLQKLAHPEASTKVSDLRAGAVAVEQEMEFDFN